MTLPQEDAVTNIMTHSKVTRMRVSLNDATARHTLHDAPAVEHTVTHSRRICAIALSDGR